ncbi:MAG: S-formylglutathione hydrolase [Defluviitaleaceae bacterium]|nr:S-formylglutathione hydrolase [Defluviitaleaceae bacterium]
MSIEQLEQHVSFGGQQFKYKHQSDVLKSEVTFSLFLPSNPDGKKIPLIWWLSGLTCTDDNFTHKSGFQQWAEQHQVAVIAPDTSPRGDAADGDGYDLGHGAGFYVNATEEPWASHYHMYDYVTKELTGIVHELVPNFSGKESVMGHSMGGHGALVIGLRNQDRFASISAFAPILTPSKVPWGVKILTAYLGSDQETWKAWDSTALVAQDEVLPILVTQGTGDSFYPDQLTEQYFLAAAQKHGDQVTYEQQAGYDHSYYFIATFLKQHFDFHMNHLNS